MQFNYRFITIQNNLKKNMQVNFRKYLILNHHIRFYTLIIPKKNYKKYLPKTMVRQKKNKHNN